MKKFARYDEETKARVAKIIENSLGQGMNGTQIAAVLETKGINTPGGKKPDSIFVANQIASLRSAGLLSASSKTKTVKKATSYKTRAAEAKTGFFFEDEAFRKRFAECRELLDRNVSNDVKAMFLAVAFQG